MSTLVTLDQAKERLGIAPANTTEDVSIQLALDSAEEHLVELYGYTFTAGEKTDILRNKRLQDQIFLAYRPVTSITSAKARYRGADSEVYDLEPDLIDPDEGIIALWPDPEALFPPSYWYNYSPFNIITRWRYQNWPVVTVVYQVTALEEATAPVSLKDTVLDLGIYWHRRGGAAEHLSSNIGGVQETFLAMGVPRWVAARIPHKRRQSVRVV